MIRPIVRMALAIACISSVFAHAQSYYTYEWCDVDDPAQSDCTPYTEIIGDPGISGCDRQATLSSTLNGQYASASTVYPTTAMVTQSVSNATPGVDYPWTYTYTFYYDNPYGKGGCALGTVSWKSFLAIAVTTYKLSTVNANDTVTFTQSCPGTSRASCGAANYLGSQPTNWAEEFQLKLTTGGQSGYSCFPVSIVQYLNGPPAPYPCT
jgi:hypothetical protein